MEVIRISLFLKQKLMVMMIDVSMACTVSKFYTDTPEQEAVSVSEWCGVWFCWSCPRFRYFRRCSAALGHPPGCDPPDRGGGWVWKSKRKPGGGGAAARRTHHCCQRIQCSPTRTSDPDRGSFWGRGWLQEGTVSRAQASDQDKVLMSTDSFVMSRWHVIKFLLLCRVWWRTACTRRCMWSSWCTNMSSLFCMTMAAASTRDTECSECSTHHCSAVHPSALTVSGVPPPRRPGLWTTYWSLLSSVCLRLGFMPSCGLPKSSLSWVIQM